MIVALQRLAVEDPSFRMRTDEETGQTIISGMGELHLETVGLISRLPSTRLSHPFAGSSVADQPAAVSCIGRVGRRQVTVVVSCP